MTKTKIALGCSALILMGTITIGIFMFLFYKMATASVEKTADVSDEVIVLLKEKGSHPDTCVQEYTHRIESCEAIQFSCAIDVSMFLSTCLSYLETPEHYCADVPQRMDIFRGPKWGEKQCARFGSKTKIEQCGSGLFQLMTNFCNPIGLRIQKDINKKPVRFNLP